MDVVYGKECGLGASKSDPRLFLLPHLSLPPPGTLLALKQLPKASTSLRGFLYEFCVGLSLGVHEAVVAAYGIGIESADSYNFLTEAVLHGDLITFIQPKVGTYLPAGSCRNAPKQPGPQGSLSLCQASGIPTGTLYWAHNSHRIASHLSSSLTPQSQHYTF